MMKKVLVLVALLLFMSSSVAFGYLIGSSNLDLMGYPEFKRNHPLPQRPYTKDQYSLNQYRDEVERYVGDAKRYVEAANNDIQQIQDCKSEAIRNANQAIDEYNSFVKGY